MSRVEFRRPGVRGAFVVVALVLASSVGERAARAQELEVPAARQGYYFGGGLRLGGMNVHTDAAGHLGLMNGTAFLLRGGQMAGEVFGFGLALLGGGGGNKSWGGGFGGLLMDLQVVPSPNVALRAGIGLGAMGVSRTNKAEAKDDDPKGGAGAVYTLGLSYDWFPWYDDHGADSGGLGVTTFAEVLLLPGDGLFATGVFVGVEFDYWTGLGRNKLKLPDREAFSRD